MMVKMVCPQCGAQLEMDENRDFMFCQHCGTKVMNAAQKYEIKQDISVNQRVDVSGTVIHKIDNTGKANLFINFLSVHPGVGMVVRIADTGDKRYYMSGQTLSYHLLPGQHVLVLKIGKKNYKRVIVIPETNEPVSIFASWDGRAHINIDQPVFTTPVAANAPAPLYPATQNPSVNFQYTATQKPKRTWMSIVGFVCSLTMIGCVFGLVFCIIDLVQNEKDKGHGLSIAGVIISSVSLLMIILNLL